MGRRTEKYGSTEKQPAQTARCPRVERAAMRFSIKRSLGNAFPKLNVEGSNPFARFQFNRLGPKHLRPESERVICGPGPRRPGTVGHGLLPAGGDPQVPALGQFSAGYPQVSGNFDRLGHACNRCCPVLSRGRRVRRCAGAPETPRQFRRFDLWNVMSRPAST